MISSFGAERFALGQEVTWKCGESAEDGVFVSKIGEVSMISDSPELFRESLLQILINLSGRLVEICVYDMLKIFVPGY